MRVLGVASGNSFPPLLTARNFEADTEGWSYDAAGDEEEDGRALGREAARRYQVAALFETELAALLEGQAKI